MKIKLEFDTEEPSHMASIEIDGKKPRVTSVKVGLSMDSMPILDISYGATEPDFESRLKDIESEFMEKIADQITNGEGKICRALGQFARRL